MILIELLKGCRDDAKLTEENKELINYLYSSVVEYYNLERTCIDLTISVLFQKLIVYHRILTRDLDEVFREELAKDTYINLIYCKILFRKEYPFLCNILDDLIDDGVKIRPVSIISNNCQGQSYYNYLRQTKYNSPFVDIRISGKGYKILLEKFEELNLYKITDRIDCGSDKFEFKIDDKFWINPLHYRSVKEFTTKWNTRLDRMRDFNNHIVLIPCTYDISMEWIQSYLCKHTNGKYIVYVNQEMFDKIKMPEISPKNKFSNNVIYHKGEFEDTNNIVVRSVLLKAQFIEMV
jgi:uncharacterized protein (DUF1919 family)